MTVDDAGAGAGVGEIDSGLTIDDGESRDYSIVARAIVAPNSPFAIVLGVPGAEGSAAVLVVAAAGESVSGVRGIGETATPEACEGEACSVPAAAALSVEVPSAAADVAFGAVPVGTNSVAAAALDPGANIPPPLVVVEGVPALVSILLPVVYEEVSPGVPQPVEIAGSQCASQPLFQPVCARQTVKRFEIRSGDLLLLTVGQMERKTSSGLTEQHRCYEGERRRETCHPKETPKSGQESFSMKIESELQE